MTLEGHTGRLMSMVLSREHRGRAQSKERSKCAHDPQTSAAISTRISTTMISSISHSTRPRSAPTMMSIRMWMPFRCTWDTPMIAISGISDSIRST